MFDESLVVVSLKMTSQWRHKVMSFSDMDRFWSRWAWNSDVNELYSTCCHHKTSKNTSNLFLTNNWSFILGLLHRIYHEETESHKSIIWLVTSVWRHFKWHRLQTWTKPRIGIQKDVCEVTIAPEPFATKSWNSACLPPLCKRNVTKCFHFQVRSGHWSMSS